MAVGQETPAGKRYAFWTTGLILCAFWQLGSLVGALVGKAIDPKTFGLDAASPAIYLALMWPALKRVEARWVALTGAVIALALVPVAPRGVPVIAAAGAALVGGLLPQRTRQGHRPGRRDRRRLMTALWIALIVAVDRLLLAQARRACRCPSRC